MSDAEKIMDALNELWTSGDLVLGKLHVRDDLIDILETAKADAWDEGAIWGFDERGPVDSIHLQLVPSDNPYRAVPDNTKDGNE